MELYKGLGLVVIYLMARREFDNVMDGLVYGAMIGLGFQVMENVQYFMFAAAGQGGTADAVVSMFFLRVVLSGLYSHMLFTGFLGFGFAYFVTQRGKGLGKRLGVLAASAALSWGAHFVWNSPWLESLMGKGTGAFAGALVIKGLPFLILLVLLGGWIWYSRFGSHTKPVFAVRFPDPVYSGQSEFAGENQIVFLHGDTLARYDLNAGQAAPGTRSGRAGAR